MFAHLWTFVVATVFLATHFQFRFWGLQPTEWLSVIGNFEISIAFCRRHLLLFFCSHFLCTVYNVIVCVCFHNTHFWCPPPVHTIYHCWRLKADDCFSLSFFYSLIVISWQCILLLQHLLPIYMFAHTATVLFFLLLPLLSAVTLIATVCHFCFPLPNFASAFQCVCIILNRHYAG